MNDLPQSEAPEDLALIVGAISRHVARIHGHDLPAGVAGAMAKAIATAIEPELDERITAAHAVGLQSGFIAVLGRTLGPAVLTGAAGQADSSKVALAPGLSRAVTSKWICRVRRNIGLQVEHPLKARAGRKPAETKPSNP